MLIELHMKGVGPAEEMGIAFKPRMNFITGDNGLGKSFLLDVAWWALTGTWARDMARPRSDAALQPRIDGRRSSTAAGDAPSEVQVVFERALQAWVYEKRPPTYADIVVYARADGGISIADPFRLYLISAGKNLEGVSHFTAEELLEGRAPREGAPRLEGLIRDWASWQREKGEAYTQLCRVLEQLSPDPDHVLRPGELKRVSIEDSRHHPTLAMPYGVDVPLIHASAAMRRIASLAYALVWAWREHHEAAQLVAAEPLRSIVLLTDEIESHLHPQWQRRIVPALLGVMNALTKTADVAVQLITVTHSPLVLASVEPDFDAVRDAIWLFDLNDESKVTLEEFPFTRRGGADDWLTSRIFGLYETGSPRAQEALKTARRLLLEERPDPQAIETADKALRQTLGGTDPFWMRWSYWRDQQLGRGEDGT